jgi:hypothetical protein
MVTNTRVAAKGWRCLGVNTVKYPIEEFAFVSFSVGFGGD